MFSEPMATPISGPWWLVRPTRKICRVAPITLRRCGHGHEYSIDHRRRDISVWRVRLLRPRALVLSQRRAQLPAPEIPNLEKAAGLLIFVKQPCGVKQEAFMNWARVVWIWNSSKTRSSTQFRERADDKGARFDLIGAETPSDDQSRDAQTAAFRPDDRGRRSEFSLHIGC